MYIIHIYIYIGIFSHTRGISKNSGPNGQFRTFSGPFLALRSGSGPSPEFRTFTVPLKPDQEKQVKTKMSHSYDVQTCDEIENYGIEWSHEAFTFWRFQMIILYHYQYNTTDQVPGPEHRSGPLQPCQDESEWAMAKLSWQGRLFFCHPQQQLFAFSPQ